MSNRTQTNFFLIISNVISLTYFSTPPKTWTSPILILITYIPLYFSNRRERQPIQPLYNSNNHQKSTDIKIKMQTVSLLSLIAAFVINEVISDLFAVMALGLAINAGYTLDSANAPWAIHLSLGLGIILGFWNDHLLDKYETARDVILLVFTLPNIFIAQNSKVRKESKILHVINPYYDGNWAFSLGFISGIFLPFSHSRLRIPEYSPNTTFSPLFAKSTRYILISLILLISLFLEEEKWIFSLLAILRGALTYSQSKHEAQLYFLIGFVIVKLMIPSLLLNYMFIGYLILGVILWQSKNSNNHERYNKFSLNSRKRVSDIQGLKQPLNIQMKQIKR